MRCVHPWMLDVKARSVAPQVPPGAASALRRHRHSTSLHDHQAAMLSLHALQQSPNGGEIALKLPNSRSSTLFCNAHLLQAPALVAVAHPHASTYVTFIQTLDECHELSPTCSSSFFLRSFCSSCSRSRSPL